MEYESWNELTRFLMTDPKIVGLKARYHELTGKHLPGWNWDEYRDLNDYISRIKEMVEDAEKNDKRNNPGN